MEELRPYKIEIYVYAGTEEEAEKGREALFNFVVRMRENGAVVSARKVQEAVRNFGCSPALIRYFGDGK